MPGNVIKFQHGVLYSGYSNLCKTISALQYENKTDPKRKSLV